MFKVAVLKKIQTRKTQSPELKQNNPCKQLLQNVNGSDVRHIRSVFYDIQQLQSHILNRRKATALCECPYLHFQT